VVVDSRENYQRLAVFADSYMPKLRGKLEHYNGRAPDLRYVQRRARDREGAVAARRAQVGRHPRHRPDEALTTIDVNTGGFSQDLRSNACARFSLAAAGAGRAGLAQHVASDSRVRCASSSTRPSA